MEPQDPNFGILSYEDGRIVYDELSYDEARAMIESGQFNRGTHEIVQIQYVVYHVFDNGFRKQAAVFGDEDLAEDFTINEADQYTNPNNPYVGTVEKQVKEVGN